jgi:hypothetical protein
MKPTVEHEWPPRFTLTWQGLFNLCIGHIQNGKNNVGEEVLRRVAVHLESLGLKTADLDKPVEGEK